MKYFKDMCLVFIVVAAVKIELNPYSAQGTRKALGWSRITFLITQVLLNEKCFHRKESKAKKKEDEKTLREKNDKNQKREISVIYRRYFLIATLTCALYIPKSKMHLRSRKTAF